MLVILVACRPDAAASARTLQDLGRKISALADARSFKVEEIAFWRARTEPARLATTSLIAGFSSTADLQPSQMSRRLELDGHRPDALAALKPKKDEPVWKLAVAVANPSFVAGAVHESLRDSAEPADAAAWNFLDRPAPAVIADTATGKIEPFGD